jgi:hypothetical protein
MRDEKRKGFGYACLPGRIMKDGKRTQTEPVSQKRE